QSEAANVPSSTADASPAAARSSRRAGCSAAGASGGGAGQDEKKVSYKHWMNAAAQGLIGFVGRIARIVGVGHVILDFAHRVVVAGLERADAGAKQESLLDGHISWNHDEQRQAVHQELTALYEWWKARVIVLKAEGGFLDTVYSDEYEKDNEMLIRLIKVRSYLWT
nr:hypothetical protein [Tanacetum cinerariifolium]